jgi:LPS export ABC transporter protein LptC
VNDIEKVKLLTNRSVEPIRTAESVKLLYSDGGHIQAEMTAPEMNDYQTENPYLEMPKGLKAKFFNDSMRVTSWITADYGIRYQKDEKMEARKNVVVVNEKGDTLNTEHLIWDPRTEKLLSNEFVKITTKDQIIYGDGFEANQDFSKYKIFNIKGTLSVPGKSDHPDKSAAMITKQHDTKQTENSTHHASNS